MVCENGYALDSVRVLTSNYERPHLLPTPPACVVELRRMRVSGSSAMLLDCRADAAGGKRAARMSSTVQMRTGKVALTGTGSSERAYRRWASRAAKSEDATAGQSRSVRRGARRHLARGVLGGPGASDTSLAGKLVEGADWRSPCDLICQRHSPVR